MIWYRPFAAIEQLLALISDIGNREYESDGFVQYEVNMVQNLSVKVEIPVPPRQIRLPKGVDDRLQQLLDKQDRGDKLTAAEKREADGLVELAEMLSLMRVKSERVSGKR